MKKIFVVAFLLFLASCASHMMYDQTIFSISSDVKLVAINTNSTVRERDGQMLAQVMGISKTNQSVYYKFVWFDAQR